LRVLLIDDDAELGGMLSEYLAGEGIETQLAATGEDGVTAALSQPYDAVVLDVMLPRMSGVEVLRRLRQTSRIPIIMLTAKGDDIDRVVGLEMGADDYLAKPCYPRELVARLRAVLRRTAQAPPPLPSAPLDLGSLSVMPAHRRASWAGRPIELTASEFNLLEALMRAGGEVVGKDELSERALGRPREAYDRSVDVHVSNLRQKLQAATAGAVEIGTVRAIGYWIGAGS
jgi:two-component system OmpR family response regulator